MRRRIVVVMLALVVATLVLTGVGGALLVQRTAVTTSENALLPQVQSSAELLSTKGLRVDRGTLLVLTRVGHFDFMEPVGVNPSGGYVGLPTNVPAHVLDASALVAGDTVVGNVGDVVFVAAPFTITATEKRSLGTTPIPATDTAVLLVTRHVHEPISGWGYFLVVAAVVVVVAAAAAWWLARRITRPLERAVDATGRIAVGEHDVAVAVNRRDPRELRLLAEAINTMERALGQARDQERQFLLSVSHELRTPLTSIRGYADAVAEGATDDVPAAVAVISAEARRLERLVADLLDLARLDAHRFSLHPRRVDVAEVTAAVADGFRPEAAAAGLVVETAVPAEGRLWVEVDPDRLAQMVANLVENAAKFAARAILVGAGRVGGAVAVWVVDDGPGIDPDDLPRVFDRHYRSDRHAVRRLGTGLGLAIVAELAAASGAVVAAESPAEGGRGTRMVIWLRPVGGPPAA